MKWIIDLALRNIRRNKRRTILAISLIALSAALREIIDIMKNINKARNAVYIYSKHDALVQKHARQLIAICNGLVYADVKIEG